MILYTAKYRLPGDRFFTKVRRIKGDEITHGKQILILEDERQIHLPLDAVVIFNRKRYLHIKEKVEREGRGQVHVTEGR